MSPEQALKLHELISSLFTTPELRAWVWLHEAARPVYDALPGDVASKNEVVHALLVGLDHRGLINNALFGALLAVRPMRNAEIRAVATLLGLIPSASTQGGAPLRPLSRLARVIALDELLIERAQHLRDRRIPVDLGARIDALISDIVAGGRPKTGDVVAKARLIKPIGHGNFGTIWLAEDKSGREVAVKLFHLEKLGEGVMLCRFRRSIKALRHISADRRRPATIARLLEVEPDELAFSMPYCSGGNLDTIDKRGWTLAVKLDCFLLICRAVEFAHTVGIIHQDIKPANVVLDDSGGPMLTDFDISDVSFTTKLSSGGNLGTPVFAAPEQLEAGYTPNVRSDIYSLGRLLHFMLLERSPGHQIEADPTLENLRNFPQALVTIVRRACQIVPTQRYPTVLQLIQDIEEHQTGWAAMRAQGRRVGRWVRTNSAVLLITSLIGSGIFAGAWMQRQGAAAVVQQQQLQKYQEKLKERSQRLSALQMQSVVLSARIDGLRSAHASGILQLATLGPTDGARAKFQAEVDNLDDQITKLVEQQEQNAEIMETLKELIRREGTPAPISCDLEPIGGPTGMDYRPKVAGLDMTFVGLATGQFCMGSPEGVGDDDEHPIHPVKVSGFLMGKSEVTQAQWRIVVEAAKAAADVDAAVLDTYPSHFKGDKLPVEMVSWCDVARFANALSRLDGRSPAYMIVGECTVRWLDNATGYRLPTEAEWEYAARASTTTAYGTGDDEAALGRAGWYFGNSSGQTHDVCTAAEKPWGICDLHGNVSEWVWDWHSHYESWEEGNPHGGDGTSRVLRGGSSHHKPAFARSANRNVNKPSDTYKSVGFRLVLSSSERP